MAREGLIPAGLAKIDVRRRTPGRAIALITLLIMVLAMGLPLIHLAQATSVVTLAVFTSVNLALWLIGSRKEAAQVLRRWRYWSLVGAFMCSQVGTTQFKTNQHGRYPFQHLVKRAGGHNAINAEEIRPASADTRFSNQKLAYRIGNQQTESKVNDTVVMIAFKLKQRL